MTRKDFIKACGLLGIGLPFSNTIVGRENDDLQKSKVIIIGAGAAGLSVAYLLKKQNVNFIILEATAVFGGRMKINTTFSDFPIALGAEWISSANIDFSPFMDAPSVLQHIEIVDYLPTEEYWLKSGNKILTGTLNTFPDRKFVNSSWFNFFKDFVLPDVQAAIKYQKEVVSIDYGNKTINVQCADEQFYADKVVVTTPLPLLTKINFKPAFPAKKLKALNEVVYWNGFKAFIEFEEHFYPSFADYLIQPETSGQVSFYDAAWGQKTDKHILGLFSVGQPADKYGSLSDDEFKTTILQELDELFEGKASKHYIKHIKQNWLEEPFAKGAYVSDYTQPKTVAKLQRPIEGKVYFAGDAYTDGSDWGNVHNAIQSAKQCVENLKKR